MGQSQKAQVLVSVLPSEILEVILGSHLILGKASLPILNEIMVFLSYSVIMKVLGQVYREKKTNNFGMHMLGTGASTRERLLGKTGKE